MACQGKVDEGEMAGADCWLGLDLSKKNDLTAVSAVWRKVTLLMMVYAVLICVSRVILLAHHPSDVVGGALTGVIGAMFVRYWFAARRLGFSIGRDGSIEPLAGPSGASLKRVAREALAP